MENLDTDVIVERFNSMTILRLSCLLIDSGDKQFFSFLNIGGFFTEVSFEFFKHHDNVLKLRVGGGRGCLVHTRFAHDTRRLGRNSALSKKIMGGAGSKTKMRLVKRPTIIKSIHLIYFSATTRK